MRISTIGVRCGIDLVHVTMEEMLAREFTYSELYTKLMAEEERVRSARMKLLEVQLKLNQTDLELARKNQELVEVKQQLWREREENRVRVGEPEVSRATGEQETMRQVQMLKEIVDRMKADFVKCEALRVEDIASQARTRRNPVRCFVCQQLGHFARKCPRRTRRYRGHRPSYIPRYRSYAKVRPRSSQYAYKDYSHHGYDSCGSSSGWSSDASDGSSVQDENRRPLNMLKDQQSQTMPG